MSTPSLAVKAMQPDAVETPPPLSNEKAPVDEGGLKRAVSGRTMSTVGGEGGGLSLRQTISRAASHMHAAHGIKEPWDLKWRSHPIFLTGVVTLGVCSDILAYTIVVPVLPYRLQDLGLSNIASLTSWLLFGYSAGIFVGTFPTAWFFHKYPVRRGPLVAAVLIMIASCITFMVPNHYAAMVVSRVIQGMSSCIIWTVGFALICENIDPAKLGTNLGFAFTGLSVGATIAPPIGGALYKHLGWHAPFIFLIILLSLDTIARLFIIEVKDVKRLRARQIAHAEEHGLPIPEPSPAVAANLDRWEKIDAANVKTVKVEGQEHVVVELSAWGVLKALVSMPRGVVAFLLFFVFGFIIGAFDATLTIRVETIWDKDADFVGLIYLAGAAPSFFVGPLAGWLSDKFGTEWVIGGTLLLCLPWIPLMTLTNSLPGFIVYFAWTNCVATSLNAVASLEVAIVSKFREGISEIHEFAAMNLAFAVASAVGAIVGGQIYNNVENGWNVICWICFACFAVMVPPPLIWTGTRPLLWRALGRQGPRSGRHPDDLAKEDAEKAALDAEAMCIKDDSERHLPTQETLTPEEGEDKLQLKTSAGSSQTAAEDQQERKAAFDSDKPPVLPYPDVGHRAT